MGDKARICPNSNPWFMGISFPVLSVTANTTLTETDFLVAVDATGGAVTVSLPPAAGCSGRVYAIKKTDSSANAVTIDPNGSETIDGASTKSLSSQNAVTIIQSDGTNWLVVSAS